MEMISPLMPFLRQIPPRAWDLALVANLNFGLSLLHFCNQRNFKSACNSQFRGVQNTHSNFFQTLNSLCYISMHFVFVHLRYSFISSVLVRGQTCGTSPRPLIWEVRSQTYNSPDIDFTSKWVFFSHMHWPHAYIALGICSKSPRQICTYTPTL